MSGKLLQTNLKTGATTEVSNHFSGFGSGGLTSSRLGVRGQTVEFLGGLRGIFAIELGPLRLESVTTSNTNGLDKTRKSFVGLQRRYGQVIIGRLQSPAYEFAYKYDALSGQLGPTYPIAVMANAGINSADRLNNAITYTSPSLKGFTLQLTYSTGGQPNISADDATPANHRQTVAIAGLDYDNGPLSIGLVYRAASNTNSICTSNAGATVTCATPGSSPLHDGKKEWGIGAKYDFKFVKVYGVFQQVSPNASCTYVTSLPHVALAIPLTASDTILIDYVKAFSRKNVVQGGVSKTVDTSVQGAGLAYTHDFNKMLTAWSGPLNRRAQSPPYNSG